LRAALDAAAGTVGVAEGEDLDAATRTAYEWARPDGVVLLSPAAPSFDRYRDYRARAAAFNAALTRLLRR
jgi:UDP-N-acetylmuramoylalanine--D-glutamate ligase